MIFKSDEYRQGYNEGLKSGSPWPRWTQEYSELKGSEKWDFDDGFRRGREERWRRQEEEEGHADY